jgi:hypothetical protein
MATPVRLTLSIDSKKSATVRAAGSIASGNVVLEYDKDENQLDTIATIEKIKAALIEQYLDATS